MMEDYNVDNWVLIINDDIHTFHSLYFSLSSYLILQKLIERAMNRGKIRCNLFYNFHFILSNSRNPSSIFRQSWFPHLSVCFCVCCAWLDLSHVYIKYIFIICNLSNISFLMNVWKLATLLLNLSLKVERSVMVVRFGEKVQDILFPRWRDEAYGSTIILIHINYFLEMKWIFR